MTSTDLTSSSSSHVSDAWCAIPGWEGLYEAHPTGLVRSLDRSITDTLGRTQRRRGRVLAPALEAESGYRILDLQETVDGERRVWHTRLHVIICETFHGARPEGMEVCHGDNGVADNSARNLRWDTSTANKLDSVRMGTHAGAAQTHCHRGHALVPWLIYPIPDQPTKRVCKPCALGDAYLAYRRRIGEEITPELEIEVYACYGDRETVKHFADLWGGEHHQGHMSANGWARRFEASA